ncbi:uncharacterized protein ACDP82_017741 [Pangshura tecta]
MQAGPETKPEQSLSRQHLKGMHGSCPWLSEWRQEHLQNEHDAVKCHCLFSKSGAEKEMGRAGFLVQTGSGQAQKQKSHKQGYSPSVCAQAEGCSRRIMRKFILVSLRSSVADPVNEVLEQHREEVK